MPEHLPRLLDTKQAARYLSISPTKLRTIKEQIPTINIGRAVRFDVRDLDKFVERIKEAK